MKIKAYFSAVRASLTSSDSGMLEVVTRWWITVSELTGAQIKVDSV